MKKKIKDKYKGEVPFMLGLPNKAQETSLNLTNTQISECFGISMP